MPGMPDDRFNYAGRTGFLLAGGSGEDIESLGFHVAKKHHLRSDGLLADRVADIQLIASQDSQQTADWASRTSLGSGSALGSGDEDWHREGGPQ